MNEQRKQIVMKTCHACNGEVSENVKICCTLCGESKGFGNRRELVEHVGISENVEWMMECKKDIKFPTVDRLKRRKIVIIMAISIFFSTILPLEDKSHTSFAILIAFFVSSIPLFVDDYIIHRKKVKMYSNKEMEILED